MTKNSGVSKFFWGTQKIFRDQQNVFGADLRLNGEPKVNLGSGENIFGHLIIFWRLKKIFSGVENVSAHKINISAHKINVSAHEIYFHWPLFMISEYFPTWPSIVTGSIGTTLASDIVMQLPLILKVWLICMLACTWGVPQVRSRLVVHQGGE